MMTGKQAEKLDESDTAFRRQEITHLNAPPLIDHDEDVPPPRTQDKKPLAHERRLSLKIFVKFCDPVPVGAVTAGRRFKPAAATANPPKDHFCRAAAHG
jgi:hypothetical protein